MRKIQGLIAGLAIIVSNSAFAATEKFHLDYTFTAQIRDLWPDPARAAVVSADFTGQRNGDIITDLVFQNVIINGKAMPGGRASVFQVSSFTTPQISFSGKNNDFDIYGYGSAIDGSFFSYTKDPDWPYPMTIGMELWRHNDTNIDIGPNGYLTPEDAKINSSWHISAVPEPETYGMLLAGMGVIGLMARRRKA